MLKAKEGVVTRKPATLPGRWQPRFWDEVDARFAINQEIRRRYKELKADTGADSYQKDILCQRAVFMAIQLESMEVEAVETGKFDPGVYAQMSNALKGILKDLGLERYHKKNADIDLQSYMRGDSA